MNGDSNNMQLQQLLQIHPKELKFVFELRKQSSCSVLLTNTTYHNVAFKVKTTSPKNYCVRPNIGIIEPKSTCEFTVTMQAQKVAPPDLICKDKFLIQSAVVPAGTTDKDISAAMFVKDVGKYVNEVKLRVALTSPSDSPLSPINGVQLNSFFEDPVLKDPVLSKVEILRPPQKVANDVDFKKLNDQVFNMAKEVEVKPKKDIVDYQECKLSEPANGAQLLQTTNLSNGEQLKPVKDEALKVEKDAINESQQNAAKNLDFPQANDEGPVTLPTEMEQKLVCDVKEMKSKLALLESKLTEAEITISELTEEKRLSIQERAKLKEELVILKNRKNLRRVQAGFPLLFVVMVALVSIVLGYLLRA